MICRHCSVFPSLKAGNYISPGQETPDRDPIHPLVEPILPSIFANAASSSSSSSSSPTNSSSSNTAKKTAFKTSTNSRAIPFIYENGRQFLDAVIGTSASSSSTTIPASTSTDKLDDKDIGKQQSQEAQATDNKDEEIYKEDQGGDGGYQEDYESNWRLEMVLGQTKDLISINEKSEGIWIALWSGEERTKTRLLE